MAGKRIVRGLYVIIAALGLGAVCFAILPYLTLDPSLSRVELNPAIPLHYPLLITHIGFAFIAVIIGWLQFLPGLRKRRPVLHRWTGRVYLGCVAIGAVTGLVVGAFSASYVRQMAFLLLGLLWLFTGWKGYRKARLGRFGEHGVWMARNYALTLVAASARLLTPFCILLYLALHGGPPAGGVAEIVKQVLEINIWVGLAVNLVITEWMIVNRFNTK
ncbi:DUF2306 domain-containing protein [Paenibacillus sp. NPDC056579]|uniref:DUF2306 domain-containing protein n=1 Tax=Paenibacillus sp. NPDC056579 TaxID=3345871 RepID=UPI0036BE2548